MLIEALLATARRSPRTPAVVDRTRSLSYRQLATLSGVLGQVVSRQTRCERVGIMLPASAVFPAALHGVLWSSRIAVPLNFLLSPAELAAIVEDAGLDVIITVRHFVDLAAKLPARPVFLEDVPLRAKMALAVFRRLPRTPQVDPEATAVILHTSGTTAEPRGVELSYRNLQSNCSDSIASLALTPAPTWLNVLPPFHVLGVTANVLIPVALGATVHALPRFNPLAVIRTVAEKKVTVMLAIPSMYAAILRAKSASPDSFASLQLAMSGGEPLPEKVRLGFEERFGVNITQGYGLTETSPSVTACTPRDFRNGTVGKPIRNAEVRVVDADGTVRPQGADGEILVRGPGVMKGYYSRPEDTRHVIDVDGWLSTGDIGHFDPDGYLVVTGRAKEMLIIGGENVSPREIEAVLETHDAVLQAAVIGVEDELRGEAAVAFVIARQAATLCEQELRNFAKRSLAGFKVPKRIEIREDLPTGPTGKILKRSLRALL